MSQVGELSLTEIGSEGSIGLSDILQRATAGTPVARYVEDSPLSWEVIQGGGWDFLGVPAEADGPGATLRDLAEIAREWGKAIVPLPLLPTIMAKRWSTVAREHEGPIALAVQTRSSNGAGIIIFGDFPGIVALAGDSNGGTLFRDFETRPDSYAPSLRLAEGSVVSVLTDVARRELCVIWAAEASGCAATALRTAVAYVKEREQFGQPIGRFQAIKHHLANAHLMVEASESAAILASLESERAGAASRFAFDASIKVIEIAIQVHGGLGFTWEMGLHMYLRHVITLRDLAAGLAI
ncbi:MAG: acyl-CoA dehydrogenase family protein [Acidimicrobiales bacterium]